MATPRTTAARFPADYGQTSETLAAVQSWGDVSARVEASLNYVVATTTDDGRPYQRPVDGVFVDDTLVFGGSPETRWVRHLHQRPDVSATLPDDDQCVILEGRAELVTDPGHPLAAGVASANRAKYPQYFQDDDTPEFQPFWALRPRVVYAWSLTGFPRRATRFDFD